MLNVPTYTLFLAGNLYDIPGAKRGVGVGDKVRLVGKEVLKRVIVVRIKMLEDVEDSSGGLTFLRNWL